MMNAQAASQSVTVQAVPDKPKVVAPKNNEPLQPKSLESTSKNGKPESEIEKSIRIAEQA